MGCDELGNPSFMGCFDFDNAAQINGLPYPPPYLGIKTERKAMPKTGVNFASGSCGILPDTGNGSAVSYIDLCIYIYIYIYKSLIV